MTMSEKTVYRRSDLKAKTGLSPSTIYRMIKKNMFPKPVLLSIQAVGWRKDEVDAWLLARESSTA